MKNALSLSFGILAAMLFVQTTAFACGCPGRNENTAQAVADEFNKSSLVFTGRVTEAKWLPMTDKTAANSLFFGEVLILKFAVSNLWKGKNQKEIVWRTSNVQYPAMNVGIGGSNCEYYFVSGKTYLVYAYEIKGRLIADRCGGTREADKAGADLIELRKLKKAQKKINIR